METQNNIIDNFLGIMNAKRSGNKSLVICFLLAMVLIFLCSCGARKVSKENTVTKENTITQSTKVDSSKIVTISDTNTKIVDNGTEEEFSIVPIDTSKEMIVAGTKYKNARLSHKKVNNHKVVDSKESLTETRQNNVKEAVKSESSKSTQIETKVTDRKSSYWWLLWLLLLIPIHILWKKYGKFMPF